MYGSINRMISWNYQIYRSINYMNTMRLSHTWRYEYPEIIKCTDLWNYHI